MAKNISWKKAPRGLRQGGFTIIELLIAIAITAAVAASIYALYTNFFKQSKTQDLMVEAQQNARVALNLIEREMMNAGYGVPNTAESISIATPNSIEFEYVDPSDASLSATSGDRLKVKYFLQTTGGIQYLVRTMTNISESSVPETSQVAQYAQSFDIHYYDMSGAEISEATLSSAAGRATVRFVNLKLVTQTKPVAGATAKTFTLETHIRLRNMGIGQASNDNTPPAAPTGLQARDPGLCNRLKVKWNKNTEGDIMGYRVYYGVASGSYDGAITIPSAVLNGSNYSCSETSTTMQCTIFPSNPQFAFSPSDGSSTTTYHIALKAYDNSMNFSEFSGEVSGNPNPSNPSFDTAGDDTTLNPLKPTAVTGLTGADAASDGQVSLSWNPYDTTNNPDVTGFRVYRSTSPFTTYPIDIATPGVSWIAGEPGSGKPEIQQSATSYIDPGPGLVGCRKYYYAIAPVKCDTTLIRDDGGDPNSKKYIQTDYAATCGDGSAACSAGTGFAAASGSDTAPKKTTAPSAPTIDARAGWKRVALSLTQPPDPDLSQTCVYVNDDSTYPEMLMDTSSYPKGPAGCYQVNMSVTPNAQLIPDSGGVFTSSELPSSASTSFWHDSMTEELPASPSLADVGTYSYRAVSFDICGNGSAPSAAQATTILCGEDPPSGEKPPAVTGADKSCCATPVTLSWNAVSSDTAMPSSPSNPYDLAGYRILRSTTADFAASTLVSGSAPFWGTSFNDATVSDGGTYYYKIVSTDCPYERFNPTDVQIKSDTQSNYLHAALVGPVKPGRIDRDEKCAGGGSCTKDAHREVMTGVTIDNSAGNGTGSSALNSTFTHDSVTLFLSNTSAGTMTVTGATVYWVDTSAYLTGVSIGGGRGGMGTFATTIDPSLTALSTNSPYTRVVSNAALTTAQVPADARYVPITFTFKDASGNPVDMRDDQLLITLAVTNDSTGVSSCTSYLTVSQGLEGVFVPYGPSVSATQQNKPSAPTFGYAVPGTSGLNTVASGVDGPVIVGSNVTVTITSNISSTTTDETTGNKVGISSATLYYKWTAKTTLTAPASGFTAVSMTHTGGNTWTADIPIKDGFRVWYYVVAKDDDGNWDRDPEMSEGAYVYDQKTFNVCDVTPNQPTGLSAVAAGANVSLNWTAPTAYTNGATINPGDTIKYRIFRGGVQIGSDQTGTSYSDNGLAAGVYTYTVEALNSCASPGPNVSSNSNTAATCSGLSSQATLTVSPATIFRGDSYTLTIVDCLAMRNDAPYTYGSTVQTVNGADANFNGHKNTSLNAGGDFRPSINETGAATGTFTATVATTGDVTQTGTKLLVGASDTISVYYPFASPNTRTIAVTVDPCSNTPKAPTGLAGNVASNKKSITLTWAAVTQNTDNSAITDLAGYKVYEKVCANGKPNCTGADIIKDWFVRTSTAAGVTTATLSSDQSTNFTGGIYYYYVTAYDSCGTPKESAASSAINENTN